MKGFKVTDKNRRKLVGVGCDSLRQLLDKGREKLGIDEEVVAALDDGTIVENEDYFQSLPPQTIIILYRKNEDIVTGVDFVLNVLRRMNTSYLETGSKAKDFLMRKTNELMDMLKESEEEKKKGIWRNTPEEDPDWFADLETNARTKDDYMFRKSQDRIRGYFYKFQEDVRKNQKFLQDSRFREVVRNCIEFFKSRLKADRYFGCYFDRRCALNIERDDVDSNARKRNKKRNFNASPEKKAKNETPIDWESNQTGENIAPTYDKFSYCDSAGTFVCQGKWKSENCEFINDHYINPYLSREARILFSTWNLDHRIERSRSVTPAFIQTIEACGKSQSVNFMYFYQLLFTKLNLKLVHVVCHDKSVHEVSCDPNLFYV